MIRLEFLEVVHDVMMIDFRGSKMITRIAASGLRGGVERLNLKEGLRLSGGSCSTMWSSVE